MPMRIRGNTYPLPRENGQKGPTGRELIDIEEYFGLDALTLLSTLSQDSPSNLPGYSKAKALFAFAWMAMVRGGEIVSIADVVDEYGFEELELVAEAANPTDPA